MKTIAIAGTFDSKGPEFAYVRDLIRARGLNTLMIHTGVFEPSIPCDVSNAEVARAAGVDILEIAAGKDRAQATEALSRGMEILLPGLFNQGRFDGVISFGGSGGTSIVTPGMRALPIGVPKLMVSTMAGGDVTVYVGASDIIMYPSIVDVAGLNSISKKIFANAVHAIAGMVEFENDDQLKNSKKPLIAATMFGVTTPCVDAARLFLEARGYEVLVFHATGTGGKAMENLIAGGYVDGVLDITTTEWCDEIVGGVLAAGPNRLEAAGRAKIPQVVSVGALDMVNFGPVDSIPAKFSGRHFYKHNPTVTLMRTTVDENIQIGAKIAEKLNLAQGSASLLLPLQGVSMLDAPGQPFFGENEDDALFETLRAKIDRRIVDILELPLHINDPEFARAAAARLIELMETDNMKTGKG
jgi:uncharacterized protein (UPF0261 family)